MLWIKKYCKITAVLVFDLESKLLTNDGKCNNKILLLGNQCKALFVMMTNTRKLVELIANLSWLQTDQQMDCALDLMRRLPPQQIEKNLTDLIDLVPSMCDDLLSSVDQPLKIAQDKTNGKDYLLCDYNRDGDSYRSPWSNTYDPPLEDGSMPSERLRKLEIDANHAFDQYREMYFEGGVSSVYLWDMDHGFAGTIFLPYCLIL